MSLTFKIPKISEFRGQGRVPSQVQDSTVANVTAVTQAFQETGNAVTDLQEITAVGTIAPGVLVLATLPATGTYVLLTHGLGRVASGFLLVGKNGACDVFQDPLDPGAPMTNSQNQAVRVGSGPTQANRNPTQNIRLQSNAAGPVTIALWIF